MPKVSTHSDTANDIRNTNGTLAAYSLPLADALFTSTQERLLGLLFGQSSRSFFCGSVVEQSDSVQSRVDLLVVSDHLTLEDLYSHLSAVERQVGRHINPILYTASEFRKRRTSGNAVLKCVFEGPTSLLVGNLRPAHADTLHLSKADWTSEIETRLEARRTN